LNYAFGVLDCEQYGIIPFIPTWIWDYIDIKYDQYRNST
jgi:hypothetical protein